MTDERDADVRRRMASHELYTDAGDGLETLARQRQRGKELAFEFNATHPSQEADRERLLGEIFARVGERVWVEPPLQVSYGCHTHLGESVYVNFNLTVVDDGEVFIGNRVMIAPNVTITSTGHPVHPVLRTDGSQFSAPVRIEDDVWIGAGATILPGVVIGAGSVVAAGAVVAQNVPPMTVVGGVPARVIREITEADLEYRYRPPRDLPVPPQH